MCFNTPSVGCCCSKVTIIIINHLDVDSKFELLPSVSFVTDPHPIEKICSCLFVFAFVTI